MTLPGLSSQPRTSSGSALPRSWTWTTPAWCMPSCLRPCGTQIVPAGGREGARPADLEVVGVFVRPCQEHGGEEVPGAHEDSIDLVHLHADAFCHHRAIGVPWRRRARPMSPKTLGQQRTSPSAWELACPPPPLLPCMAARRASVASQGFTGTDTLSRGRMWILEPLAGWPGGGGHGTAAHEGPAPVTGRRGSPRPGE